MRMAPRHHQGPSSAALWLKIAISWKTVAAGVKQFVYITLGDASLEVVETGEGMKSQFCVNTWRSRTGISLKNVVEYCKLNQFRNKNAGLVNNIFGNLTKLFLSLCFFVVVVSFWSNARLTLKLCIFRLALILALFSFLVAMSDESKCGQIEYQKHLSC